MSSFDQLKEPLNRVRDCAWRIAELSHAEVMYPGTVQDEMGRLNRKLPRLNKQVITAFQGDARLVAELLHDLKCMRKDASDLADWTSRQSKELFELNEAIAVADDSADKIALMSQKPQAIWRASVECQKRYGVVHASCERAYLTAIRVCAAADEAALGLVAEPDPAPKTPTPEDSPKSSQVGRPRDEIRLERGKIILQANRDDVSWKQMPSHVLNTYPDWFPQYRNAPPAGKARKQFEERLRKMARDAGKEAE